MLSTEGRVGPPAVTDGPRPRGAFLYFLVTWLLLSTLLAAWSFTTPLFASPDESAHVSKAAAVASGQLTGTTVEQPGTYFEIITEVQLPGYYAEGMENASCFLGDTSRSAECAPRFDADDERPTEVQTWVGRYPPLYYAVVGLPSLVSDGTAAVYGMRVASAVLCALFFALGLTSLRGTWHPRSLQAAGLLAITPTAVFFGGMVNASGLEIAAGFATWALLAPLVVAPGTHQVRGRLLAGVATAGVLLNTRPGSGLLALLVLVCLAVLATKEFWRSVFTGARWVPATVLGVVAAVAAGWWLLAVDPTASLGGIPAPELADPVLAAEGALDLSGRYLAEQLAVFGVLNLPLHPALLAGLGVVLALLVAAGLVLGRGGHRRGLLLLLVLTLVVPVVVQVPSAADLGLIWQGRYGLPLSIGLPVVAMLAVVSARGGARLGAVVAPLLLAAAAAIQIASLVWSFRRYAVGEGSPFLSGPVQWLPPGGWTWLVLGCLAPLLLAVVVLVDTRRPRLHRSTETALASRPAPEV